MDKVYRSIIAIADQPNQNKNVYTKEALQKIAEENEAFEFDGEKLYHMIKFVDLDPEAQKILEDNFWDLV